MKPRIPKKLSPGEEGFMDHCRIYGLEPIREHVFHPTRKWRFDFYFPESKLAVEIEGVTRKPGRHQMREGYEQDTRKYNAAALMGITVLRYTTAMVMSAEAINDVLGFLRR